MAFNFLNDSYLIYLIFPSYNYLVVDVLNRDVNRVGRKKLELSDRMHLCV